MKHSWLFLTVYLLTQSMAARAQDTACDAAEFDAEVVSAISKKGLCPRPIDPTLERLATKNEQTAAKDTQVFFDVLRGLRDYARSQSSPQGSTWRAGLAQHIDRAFELAKDKRLPAAHFAKAINAQPDLDPDTCLFVTAGAGQPGYACYVLQGATIKHPQGESVVMAVYELSDFADAYLAYRALAIARKASLKLDVPALDVALERLTRANQRWTDLRKRGYLQYPWELLFGSVFSAYSNYQACFATDALCTGEEGLDPERLRLIALHPGVGMGFSGFGWKKGIKPSADASLALSLEVLGATYYQADFKNYFGASLGAVVNDGDFGDVRPGVFVHITRWVHLGYLLSVFQRDTRYDGTVFLSTDLGSALGLDFLE